MPTENWKQYMIETGRMKDDNGYYHWPNPNKNKPYIVSTEEIAKIIIIC